MDVKGLLNTLLYSRSKGMDNKTGKVFLNLDIANSHPVLDKLNSVDTNFKVVHLSHNITMQLKRVYRNQV